MTFANLPPGAPIFLDANTLVYHFQPHPLFGPACNQLVQRIEQQDLLGFTSTHILSELAHRLMTIEASGLPGWSATKIVAQLKQQPAVLSTLTRFRAAVETVLQSRLQILTVAPSMVSGATGISQQSGLLSNDALIVAVMQANGLTNLASNDSDFDRVSGITRYSPA
jgi:predicted nucleic acid-binding protein